MTGGESYIKVHPSVAMPHNLYTMFNSSSIVFVKTLTQRSSYFSIIFYFLTSDKRRGILTKIKSEKSFWKFSHYYNVYTNRPPSSARA